MKKHSFGRVIVLYIATFLLAFVLVELHITKVVNTTYLGNLKKSLSFQASLTAELFSSTPPQNVDRFCREIKEKTGARVMITDNHGKILGDSERGADETAPLLKRGDTSEEDTISVRIPVMQGAQRSGFIILSTGSDQVNSAVNMLRIKINIILLLLLFLSGGILFALSSGMKKLVTQITEYSGALSRGLFRKKLYLQGTEECAELSHNLNTMAAALEGSMREKDEEANRLNVILKSIPDAFLLINIKGAIEMSNTAAKDLFGQPALDGKPYLEVVRSPCFINLIEEVKERRMPGFVEIVIDIPQERHLSVRVSPLSYTVGELAGMVAIFHDTTHLKKLEQVRTDFVANVSHEIKTPVTAIRGFAETLLDGAIHDRENAERFLKTIQSHSERLSRLVDDLLTLSRVELGEIRINKTEVDLSDIFRNVFHTMEARAAEKNLSLKGSTGREDTIISADHDKVMQILLNLVDNAIKFTETGEIEIGIAREQDRRFFFVKDSGVGIMDKYIPRLGERFFRVDPSRSRQLGGTGLGLAIVKHLVIAHGWKMKIESEVHKGTIVKVYYSS